MDVICNNCNKEFHIRLSFYKKNKTKIFYCCKQCMLDYKHVDKTTVKCATCDKEFVRRVTEVANNNFCNQSCFLKFKPLKDIICEFCNKEFTVDESYYKKQSKRGQTPRFCSVECRNEKKRENSLLIKCLICNKEFRKRKDNISTDGNCCSFKCRKEYHNINNRVTTNCNHCNKEISVNKYRFEHSNKIYCNRKCIKEYKSIKKEKYTDSAHYLRTTDNYKKWRMKCLERDDFECCKCASKEALHIHHKNSLWDIFNKYNEDIEKTRDSEEFNDINNGITLCTDCHSLEHPFVPRDKKGRFCRPHSKPLKS